MFAMKIMSQEEVDVVVQDLDKITDLKKKDAEILAIADNLDKDIVVLGSSALEDELQTEVPETIEAI